MADPGSSDEPPRKKPRHGEPHKVKVLFKAPGQKSCEISLYAFWLSPFEFFEAKLKRWTDDTKGEPIVLELPRDCDPQKGAALFRKRLVAAEVNEDETWDSVKWWRASEADEEALFVALYIFDLVLMQPYCKEVAETLSIFQIECSASLGSLAKKYVKVICTSKPQRTTLSVLGPIDIGSLGLEDEPLDDALDAWFFSLTKGDPLPSHQLIIERALAGCQPKHLQNFFGRFACLLIDSQPRSSLHDWAVGHVKALIARKPDVVGGCAKQCLDRMKNAATKNAAISFAILVLHSLLIESSRKDLEIYRQMAIFVSIVAISAIASSEFEAEAGRRSPLLGASAMFKSQVSIPIFSAAGKSAQEAFVKSLGKDIGRFFCGKVHLLHPHLRQPLLAHFEDLSPEDIECLSTTSFFEGED